MSDWTPSHLPVEELCAADNGDGFLCTRLPGHPNDHVAGDGENIIDVWSDES